MKRMILLSLITLALSGCIRVCPKCPKCPETPKAPTAESPLKNFESR